MNTNETKTSSSEAGVICFPVFGARFRMTMDDLRQRATHPLVPMFLIIVAALLIVFDLHDYRTRLSIGATAVVWFVCMFTLWGFTFSFYAGAILISRRFSKMIVFVPVLGALAMTINTFTTTGMVAALMGDGSGFELFKNNIFRNIVASFLFETIFYLYVLPTAELVVPPVADDPVSRTITIAGHKFRARDIISMSSQDHYLEVRTHDRTLLLRGRLSDAVSQLPETFGVMPHRSHWTARSAVDGISVGKSPKVLRLKDGRTIPIARGRLSDVQDCYKT